MQRVLVVDKHKQPLMPCHPARARELLKKKRAAVYRQCPFTIIIFDRVGGDTQDIEFKVDPGAKTSGLALVADCKRGKKAVWMGELEHKGFAIKEKLEKRRAVRRSRRNRKARYRQPRFNNRCKPKGWIAPSLQSRVDNLRNLLIKLYKFVPITSISMELVRFDTQKMENAEISGIEYQQGELLGYEVREYLLEKFNRTCVYCGVRNVPLQIDHITPKSRGGSNRIGNLAIACQECNQRKGSQTAEEFGYPNVQAKAKKPLRSAAMMNITRWKILDVFKETELPVSTGTGGMTKYNRTQQNYLKAHCLDAACVGESGTSVFIHPDIQPLLIKAMGRGSRQMCRVDKFGFPRTSAKKFKRVKGFQTGDMVKAIVPSGKYAGTHVGRVAVRSTGSFDIKTATGKVTVSHKYCSLIHQGDGYQYTKGGRVSSPPLKLGVSTRKIR